MEEIGTLVACVLLAALGGRMSKAMGVPSIVGVMVTGVTLGILIDVLSDGVRPFARLSANGAALDGLAAVSITIFMVEIGRHLRGGVRSVERRSAGRLSGLLTPLLVTILPMAAGLAMAPLTWPHWSGTGVPWIVFAIAQACLFTMTAVPVLHRVLVEQQLLGDRRGQVALQQSLVTECIVWLCVVVVVGFHVGDAAWQNSVSLAAIIVTAVVLRLAWRQVVDRLRDGFERRVAFGLLMLAAAATCELLGANELLCGLLVGVLLPRGRSTDETVVAVSRANLTLLFPLFFVKVGVDVGLPPSPDETSFNLWAAGLVLMGAFIVKWVSAWAGVFVSERDGRVAASSATMLSLRGATELALAAMFFEVGVIDEAGLAAFVAFAVITTLVAVVGLRIIHRPRGHGDRTSARPDSGRVGAEWRSCGETD